ncbi:MAG: alpha/beta fold hydrolase [Woeseiaceae bacterium]|nr:alpha/beta fold hydrolase [Woeseiaceae bacterium]
MLVARKHYAVIVATLGAIFLTACSGPQVQPLMPTPVVFSELGFSPLEHIPESERWTPRRVYYATTRQRDDNLQRIDYGNTEGDKILLGMTLIGFGGPDLSWSDLSEYSRQGERSDIVDLSIAGLVEIGPYTPAESGGATADDSGALSWFMSDLNASIESARDRDLLIYVHGAKVNFYNASAFAAQLDHFMGRDMTSIAFSWPTRQNILAYAAGSDVQRAYRTAPALASLLDELAKRSSARRIHIVCWSAGGRVVTAALKHLYDQHAGSGEDIRERFRIGTVYFAAADVPDGEFIDALPSINDLATRIIVTESSKDGALDVAKSIMGGGARIGQRDHELTPEQLTVIEQADRLEVVDVSHGWEDRGFDITGHRYWFDHPWASSDVVLSIRSDFSPQDRGLTKAAEEFLWKIPADYVERLRKTIMREDLILREQD